MLFSQSGHCLYHNPPTRLIQAPFYGFEFLNSFKSYFYKYFLFKRRLVRQRSVRRSSASVRRRRPSRRHRPNGRHAQVHRNAKSEFAKAVRCVEDICYDFFKAQIHRNSNCKMTIFQKSFPTLRSSLL